MVVAIADGMSRRKTVCSIGNACQNHTDVYCQRVSSVIFFAIMTVVRCVLAGPTVGMIEASMTRSPVAPITRHCGSTTDGIGPAAARRRPGW